MECKGRVLDRDDAKCLGESATLATAPAILNAILHATGARTLRFPAAPERVLATIRQTSTARARSLVEIDKVGLGEKLGAS